MDLETIVEDVQVDVDKRELPPLVVRKHHFIPFTSLDLETYEAVQNLTYTQQSIPTPVPKKTIMYTKTSLGKESKPIRVYKIRTMKPNADKDFSKLVQTNGVDEKGNIKNDPRITSMGKFMRKYWIDELPQFYNILKGDLKIVGFRPMAQHHWDNYPKDIQEGALRQKPGLWGINYAVPKGEEVLYCFDLMRSYIKDYEKAPLRTDLKYFFKINYNILFRGVRSS